jgi:hypothetical protein
MKIVKYSVKMYLIYFAVGSKHIFQLNHVSPTADRNMSFIGVYKAAYKLPGSFPPH